MLHCGVLPPWLVLPPRKTIKVKRTRHAGHCWRSRDELISDVLLWTPSLKRAKARRLARTYTQQLCADSGCNPEDLLEAIGDREGWREKDMDICVDRVTWWWWWFNGVSTFIGIFGFIHFLRCISVMQGASYSKGNFLQLRLVGWLVSWGFMAYQPV